VAIPEKSLILLSGVPATGKSNFGRYLAREHGFAHYDLECHPRCWPHPDLKAAWDASPQAFVKQLMQLHKRVALDWGFPVHCLPVVNELQAQGVRLIWFDGDRSRARTIFQERGGLALSDFDAQVAAIAAAGYPKSLNCVVVMALSAQGTFKRPKAIEHTVFA
jgi:hypothetical protein